MAKADRKLTCFAKRHYEAIAEAMQEARTHLRCDAINQHECVIGMLAFHQCVPARRKHEGAIMSTVPMYGAVMTLARYQARKEIKRQLYAKGIKLAHVESREITIAANKYIDEHPEIITFATQDYHRLVVSGRLRPPRQKETVQHLGDLHGDGSPELQGLSLCRYRERNETLGHERP